MICDLGHGSGRSRGIYPWMRGAWYVIPRFKTHARYCRSVSCPTCLPVDFYALRRSQNIWTQISCYGWSDSTNQQCLKGSSFGYTIVILAPWQERGEYPLSCAQINCRVRVYIPCHLSATSLSSAKYTAIYRHLVILPDTVAATWGTVDMKVSPNSEIF